MKMFHPAVAAKILEFCQSKLIDPLSDQTAQLVDGNLYKFEQELYTTLHCVYDFICEQVLPIAAGQILAKVSAPAGCRITKRNYTFRLGTGKEVKLTSNYFRTVSENFEGCRHQLARHWNCIDGCSPGLYDRIAFFSMLAPSYELAHRALAKTHTEVSLSSVRDITNRLANHCYAHGEQSLALKADESLAGKRVLIGIDGGRSRTRNYLDTVNENGNQKYTTPWMEPKLFVIDTLDEQGCLESSTQPLYGCRFGDTDCIETLEKYLAALQIDQASEVQIVADGAPWIWNQVGPMLDRLGVTQTKRTETLDYYHAVSYLHNIVEAMPRRISEQKRKNKLKEFKEALWQGKCHKIVEDCKEIFKRPGKLVRRWMNYFEKHQKRMQYADNKENNLCTGSGIIESGVRRIINLRFKNTSTFWQPKVVEKLYFLRCSLISGRWDTLMENLTKSC